MSHARETFGLERQLGQVPEAVNARISEMARTMFRQPDDKPFLNEAEAAMSKAIVRRIAKPIKPNLAPTYPSSPEMVVVRHALHYVRMMALYAGGDDTLPPEELLPPHRTDQAEMRHFVDAAIDELPTLTGRTNIAFQVHDDLEYLAGEPKFSRLAYAAVFVGVAALEATRLDYEVHGDRLPFVDQQLSDIETSPS